jgi:hypothetical protein
MGNITLPNALTDGTTAFGSQVRANDDAIVAQVNGNIEDVNIKASAAINGSKLSNVAGSRIPTDRIEDDAVTADKLRDDATVDANRAVTTNHLRDGAVTAAKIASLAVILSKVKLAHFEWTIPGDLSADGTNSISTGITTSTGIPVFIEVRAAGAPSAVHARLQSSIYLNTSTSTYHLMISNPDDGGVLAVSGVVLRVWYIPAS